MYERFTDRARKVYQLANQEAAQRFSHDKVDVFHILIALLKEDHGVAANILKNLGVNLRKLRLEVDKHVEHVVAGPEWLTMGKLPHTEAAARITPFAIKEAEALGHNYVGTEHLLLGIVREEFTGMPGIAGKVLIGLGLDRTKIRDEVMAIITPPESATEHKADGPIVPSRFVRLSPNEYAEASRNVRAQTSAWSILRNDPTFKAIMQETEYAFYEKWMTIVKLGRHQTERAMLTHFVEMLAAYGYTITRTPINEAEVVMQIGVDMAAGGDFTAASWHFPKRGPEELKLQEQMRELCNDWCKRVGLEDGETKEVIRKEMISTVVENVKHFKHALTVEELIDVPTTKECQNCGGNTSNEAMTCDNCLGGQCYYCGALPGCTPNCSKCAPIECTCKSLLNGHENGCPLASK